MIELQHQKNFGVIQVRDLAITVSAETRSATSFSPAVQEKYLTICTPDEQEWRSGEKSFPNGVQSSIEDFQLRNGILTGVLKPTRFAWGQASTAVIKEAGEKQASAQGLLEHSANMANTWLICLVKYQGEWHISGQIKGANTVGGGQLHPALAAGGVSGKLLNESKPASEILKANTLKEASEEGAPLNAFLTRSQIAFALDERVLGNVVFGYAGKSEFDDIRNSLSARAKQEHQADKVPEVAGQALYNPALGDRLLINVDRILKSGQVSLVDLPSIIVDPGCVDFVRTGISNGLVPRPALQIFLDWIKEPKNLRYLMDQAGI